MKQILEYKVRKLEGGFHLATNAIYEFVCWYDGSSGWDVGDFVEIEREKGYYFRGQVQEISTMPIDDRPVRTVVTIIPAKDPYRVQPNPYRVDEGEAA